MVDESADGSEARGGMPGTGRRKLRPPAWPWEKRVKRAIEALDRLIGEADTEERRRALVQASGWGLPLLKGCTKIALTPL